MVAITIASRHAQTAPSKPSVLAQTAHSRRLSDGPRFHKAGAAPKARISGKVQTIPAMKSNQTMPRLRKNAEFRAATINGKVDLNPGGCSRMNRRFGRSLDKSKSRVVRESAYESM